MALVTLIGAGIFGFICAAVSYALGAGFPISVLVYLGSGWGLGLLILSRLAAGSDMDATRLRSEVDIDLMGLRNDNRTGSVVLERGL